MDREFKAIGKQGLRHEVRLLHQLAPIRRHVGRHGWRRCSTYRNRARRRRRRLSRREGA
jgi:hypothetical protein